jgi:type III pantothenate kinase
MQLAIDIGNTRIKAAIFEKDVLKENFLFPSAQALIQADLLKKFPVKRSVLGSVAGDMSELQDYLAKDTDFLLFKSDTPIPVKNLYRTAHTLGSDRLSAAVGANAVAPDQNLLVIDAGTCIKYNLVNDKNEYLGGAISPGLQMRFKAMNTFTARLPLLETDPEFSSVLGTGSDESIRSGAQNGAVYEADGFIEAYKKDFNNLKVFLTGGDCDFFAKRLKNRIFADQNLILKGLNRILSHNNSV